MTKIYVLIPVLLAITINASAFAQTKSVLLLPASPGETKPLRIGDRMPDVTVADADGTPVSLQSLHQDGPVVLVFFRGSWCPFCIKHTQDLIRAYPAIQQAGAKLIGISPDSQTNSAANVSSNSIAFPILADHKIEVASEFGLAYQVDDDTARKYSRLGIDLQQASGESHQALPVPAVYIVNQAGEIVFAHSHPNYRQRLNPILILRELKKL